MTPKYGAGERKARSIDKEDELRKRLTRISPRVLRMPQARIKYMSFDDLKELEKETLEALKGFLDELTSPSETSQGQPDDE